MLPGMQLDIYKPIWFKLGMMILIDIIELCILIVVLVTLTFIQGHSCMTNEKSKNSVPVFSQISQSIMGEIQYDATTCWFVEAHAEFISHH